MSSLEPKSKYRVYLKDIKDDKLSKYVHRDDNTVYITHYEKDKKNTIIYCANRNTSTGVEYEDVFTVTNKLISKIEEIRYMYIPKVKRSKNFSDDDEKTCDFDGFRGFENDSLDTN